jgi:integral membrane sensor domain MASE1
MKIGLILVFVGILLLITGLAFAYIKIGSLEHSVTASNFISSVVSFLETELIAIAFLVVGGLWL